MKTIRSIALVLDSLLRTTVVAGLVFVFAWLLVSWAAHRPVVEAADDGTIRLTAEAATTHGPPEIRFNTFAGEENIGWWDYDNQWLTWEVDVERAGTYEIGMRCSRPGEAGVGMVLNLGEARLGMEIPGSGGWDKWLEIELGTIDLAAGEGQVATLKVVDLPSEGVINFIELELRPR